MRADAGSGAAAVFEENAAKDTIIPVDNADSWIVGSDRFDNDPNDAGAKRSRAFFDKAKGAFRAGRVSFGEWDSANVGAYSHAEGSGTKASGQSSHAEGQSTTASGQEAHAEGYSTTASGGNSHAEGYSTTASGASAHAEGYTTTASGNYAHTEGSTTTASGGISHAEGLAAVASRYAQWAKASGKFAVNGDAQVNEMVLRRQTTDAVAVPLYSVNDTLILTGTNTSVLTLLASRAHKVIIDAVARRTDVQGEMAGFSWEGLVGRDSTGNARIIGAPVTKAWSDAGAAAWTLTVGINTTDATNNYLEILATGEAGKTIRWVAEIRTVEVAG